MSDFAPQYSRRERVILVLKLLVLMVPAFVLFQYWFFDWVSIYAKTANCQIYGDYNGVQLLLYGVFVGAPLSCALVILLLEGRRSYKVIRIGQNPLPGEKVLRKTKYRYGVAARVQPAALFAIMALLVGVSIWGSFQAQKLSRNITPCNDNQMSAI